MWYGQLSVLCLLTLHSHANPLIPRWNHTRVKHTWNDVPPNWESLGPPPAGTTIDLNILLMPHDENALIDALYKVSDPSSPRYGAYLSEEQVAQLVSPHQDTLELVRSWLEGHGIPSSIISVTHGGSWLTLSAVPVARANELLGASYQLYQHTDTNDTAILRTIGYSLPAVLLTHVQTVIPTTYFSPHSLWETTPQKRSVNATVDMASREFGKVLSKRDGNGVTPAILRSLYRMESYVPAATQYNVLGVTGFSNQFPNPTDFTMFMTEYRSDAIDPVSPSYKSTMYTSALTYPTPTIFYSTGGKLSIKSDTLKPAKGDAFLEWLKFVVTKPFVPQTIIISYSILERLVPLEYATTICKIFAMLGARGASVLVASGNDGVGPGDCVDGAGRFRFLIRFPGSCPWVTTVGGTADMQPEIAASFSGGGFSGLFARPFYQESAVPAYLQRLGSQYNGLFQPYGRAIPDLSAQSTNYLFVNKGARYYVTGTSIAAPTVASIISLLNDYRLSTGRTPLGFLNPWLYGHGRKGLTDITSGSNPGCGTPGFPATVGWDPVTGLGTPDFLLLQYTLDYIPTPGN